MKEDLNKFCIFILFVIFIGYSSTLDCQEYRKAQAHKQAKKHSLPKVAGRGTLDELKAYIAKGYDVNEKDKYGWTALHKAVERGHIDMVAFLLKNGAKVNSATNSGRNAIQIPSKKNKNMIIKILERYHLAEKCNSILKGQQELPGNGNGQVIPSSPRGQLSSSLPPWMKSGSEKLSKITAKYQKAQQQSQKEIKTAQADLVKLCNAIPREPSELSLENQQEIQQKIRQQERRRKTMQSMQQQQQQLQTMFASMSQHIYQGQGQVQRKLETARNRAEKDYKNNLERLGETHPNTVKSLDKIDELEVAQAYLGAKKQQKSPFQTVISASKNIAERHYKSNLERLGETHPETMKSLDALAMIYQGSRQYEKSLPLLEKAYHLKKGKLGEIHLDTLDALDMLAGSYIVMGHQCEKGLPLAEKAYRLRKKKSGAAHPKTLEIRDRLAKYYFMCNLKRQDKKSESQLKFFEESYRLKKRELGETHPDVQKRGCLLETLKFQTGSSSGGLLPELLSAEKFDQQTKEGQVVCKSVRLILTIVNNMRLSRAYMILGNIENASIIAEKSYRLAEKAFGEKNIFSLLPMLDLAWIHSESGRLDKALLLAEKAYRDYKISLDSENINRMTGNDKYQYQVIVGSHVFYRLASIYQKSGQLDKALSLAEKSYRLAKKSRSFVKNNKAPDAIFIFTLHTLAEVYKELGRLDEALPLLEESYHLTKTTKFVESLKVSFAPKILGDLATVYAEQGHVQKGIKYFEKFVESVESLRTGDFSAENRQTLFRQWVKNYFKLSGLYMTQSRFQDAFRLAEMSKARTLLESMTGKLAIRQSILKPADQKELRDYETRLVALTNSIVEALANEHLKKKMNLEVEKNKLVSQLAKFERELGGKYPKYAKLNETKIVTAKAGVSLIPSDALFVSYLIQNNHVLVFTLDSTGDLQTRDLGVIPDIKQTLKIYQQLSGEKCTIKQLRDKRFLKPRPRCKLFDKKKPKRLYVWQLADGSFVTGKRPSPDKKPKKVHYLEEISRYLGKQLLAPIKNQLVNKPHWIISPDGSLAQITFESLILDKQLVIARHEISYVQSLSVLALLKQREQEYRSIKERGTLLAMGAARYHLPENSPKICNQPTRAPDIDIETMLRRNGNDPQRYRRAFEAKGLKWCNLPGTKQELAVLEKLFAGQRPLIYTQAAASEANLQRLNRAQVLTRYRYLLFSTHGYFDTDTPELSVIVLDQLDKTPGTDGFITAGELPGYDFKSDLMVLSACQTGLGDLRPGEGVMGLPYAFYVAGNKNTLMTLWTVPDKSTAEFIPRFFAKLKSGMGQVKALAETKREFLQDKKRSLLWAPFVLYGVSADSGISGRNPWKSDGNEAGAINDTDITGKGTVQVAALLAEIGYFTGTLDNSIDIKKIRAALKSLQTDIKLEASGRLDTQTWNKLNRVKLSPQRRAIADALR